MLTIGIWALCYCVPQVNHTVTLSTIAESGYRFGATYVGSKQTGPAEVGARIKVSTLSEQAHGPFIQSLCGFKSMPIVALEYQLCLGYFCPIFTLEELTFIEQNTWHDKITGQVHLKVLVLHMLTSCLQSFPVIVGDMDNTGSLNSQIIHQLTSALRTKIAIQVCRSFRSLDAFIMHLLYALCW